MAAELGVGTHSYCQVAFDLPAKAKMFTISLPAITDYHDGTLAPACQPASLRFAANDNHCRRQHRLLGGTPMASQSSAVTFST